MKNVLIRGPLLSKSGYGEHARQVFRYLLEKPGVNINTEILPWGITPWNIDTDNYIVREILRRSQHEVSKFDVSFQIQLPNEWDVSKANYNIGVTAAVETDRCNPMWTMTHVAKMNKVVVPSEHAKKSIMFHSTQGHEKVVVIPEAYYDEITEHASDIDISLSTDFNFLTVGVLTGETPDSDRKNLFYLIKWFIESFRSDKTTGLIVKTNRGRNTAIDRRYTRNILKKVLSELGHTGIPSIYLLHGDMDRHEMNAVYRHPTVKAFVSLTRGEGFGLPHLESAASGLPVIATNWSAHKEFLDLGRWIEIDYDLKNIDRSRVDNVIFVEGSQWAEPKEADFKRKIKKLRNSYKVPTEWAKDLQNKILDKYSWSSVRELYDNEFSEILA